MFETIYYTVLMVVFSFPMFLVCIFLEIADRTKSQGNAATKVFLQPTEWKGSGITERKRD